MAKNNITLKRSENTPTIPLREGEVAETVTLDACAGESADFEGNSLDQDQVFLVPNENEVTIDRKKFGKAWIYYILGKLVDKNGAVIEPEYWFNVNTLRRQDNDGKKVFAAFAQYKDAQQRIKAICKAGGLKSDNHTSQYKRTMFDNGKRVSTAATEDGKTAWAYTMADFVDLMPLTAEDREIYIK